MTRAPERSSERRERSGSPPARLTAASSRSRRVADGPRRARAAVPRGRPGRQRPRSPSPARPCSSCSRTTSEAVVLHGDLHHDNVLRDGDGWVVIDPHGYVGDPGSRAGDDALQPDPVRLRAGRRRRACARRPSAGHLWSEESELDPERVRPVGPGQGGDLRGLVGRGLRSQRPSTCALPGCWPTATMRSPASPEARRIATVRSGQATTVPNRCSSREERSCACSGLTPA